MIYTALCEHLGVKAEASLSELLPQVVDNRLKVTTADAWRAQRQLIPHAYAIAEDDQRLRDLARRAERGEENFAQGLDRKSTRLNSSHVAISYAVFCLKKKRDNLY